MDHRQIKTYKTTKFRRSFHSSSKAISCRTSFWVKVVRSFKFFNRAIVYSQSTPGLSSEGWCGRHPRVRSWPARCWWKIAGIIDPLVSQHKAIPWLRTGKVSDFSYKTKIRERKEMTSPKRYSNWTYKTCNKREHDKERTAIAENIYLSPILVMIAFEIVALKKDFETKFPLIRTKYLSPIRSSK